MSSPSAPESSQFLSEEALAAQAAALAELRERVAAAQAQGGKPDPALVAEFARAQRDFIEAKIAFERMRQARLAAEEAARAAAEAAAAAQAALVAQARQRERTRARILWLLVALLLTAALYFLSRSLGK